MRRLLLLLILLGLTSGWAWLVRRQPDPGELGDTVTLRVHSSGCWHGEGVELRWRRQGATYVSLDGRRGLSLDEVRALRQTLLEARPGREQLAQELGITPETVSDHRAQILEAAGIDRLPPLLEPQLGFSRVAARAVEEAAGPRHGTENRSFELTVTGSPGVTATAEGWPRPYMLPWKVEADGHAVETCSLAVPLAIAPLLAARDPGGGLLDGRDYWRRGFWKDSDAWGDLRDAVNESEARDQAAALAGYEQLKAEFAVARARIYAPEALYLALSATKVRALNAADWTCPMKNGQPRCDWRTFLALYQAAETAVKAHPWLLEWKAAAPGRSLELEATGGRGFSEERPELFLFPPWKDAGLPGRPEFELVARASEHVWATVLLSSTCREALVVSTFIPEEPALSGHWLQRTKVFYHPSDPDFILVDAEGRPHRKRGHPFKIP